MSALWFLRLCGFVAVMGGAACVGMGSGVGFALIALGAFAMSTQP